MKRMLTRTLSRIRAGFSLFSISEDTAELYGDNPNSLSPEAGVARAALANNAANTMGTGF